MAVTFCEVDQACIALCNKAVHEYRNDLESAGVTIDLLFAEKYDMDGEALPAKKIRGQVALAWTSITTLADRARGLSDAKIVIDRTFGWAKLSESRRLALFRHELKHLELVFDKDQDLVKDDQGRPKLKIRHHDFEIGGWHEDVEDEASPEAHQVRLFLDQHSQYALFPLPGTTEIVAGLKEAAK